MAKIMFFEDEYKNLEILINWINRSEYQGSLVVDHLIKTESDTDFAAISKNYDAIFVDIELANKSKDDGIAVIKQLIKENKNCYNTVAIISGHSGLRELLAKENLTSIPVFEKPIDKATMLKAFKTMLKF